MSEIVNMYRDIFKSKTRQKDLPNKYEKNIYYRTQKSSN